MHAHTYTHILTHLETYACTHRHTHRLEHRVRVFHELNKFWAKVVVKQRMDLFTFSLSE